METSEVSASAESELSTIVEFLPPVPEAYAFEEQADDSDYQMSSLIGQQIEDFDLDDSTETVEVPCEKTNGYFQEQEPSHDAATAEDPPPTEPPPSEYPSSAPETSEPPLSALAASDLFDDEPTPTKRSLRTKTRKRVYEEENSEAELPSEEESLFPRVTSSRYYSDDEYTPDSGRKSKSKSKKMFEPEYEMDQEEEEEEDEDIVEDSPRRKRRRKKTTDQKTPKKISPTVGKRKGRSKKIDPILDPEAPALVSEPSENAEAAPDGDPAEPTSTANNLVTLDSDSDIENCLQTSKIKVDKSKLLSVNSESNSANLEDKKAPPKEPKKSSSKKKTTKEGKNKSEPTSEMGKVFENFLVSNSELKVKKIKKLSEGSTSQLEIPTIDLPEIIKLMDSWTQTEKKETQSMRVQTCSPYSMRINKNVTLSSEQADNACSFMRSVLSMITDLGTLMCDKSEEFIQKKITPDYIKDTNKIAFCKDKMSLLFKLAKDTLTKNEEMLEKNYEEFINNNNLASAVEMDKTITPNVPEDDNSDCEIVEVTPTKEQTKKKSIANTVFLNKELSIKIAKKSAPEAVKTTPAGRQIKVSGRHAVWINKSIMVKKVKSNQSFLAQDRRFEKPPDNSTIEEIVRNFFDNYSKIKTCCESYTSKEWLVPARNDEIICNYFIVSEPAKCPTALAAGSGSEDDGFFEGPASNENVPQLNNQYDVVGAPEVESKQTEPQPPAREPNPLVTICIRYLHKLLHKINTIGESETTTHQTENMDEFQISNTTQLLQPQSLLFLCVKLLRNNMSTENNKTSSNEHTVSNQYCCKHMLNSPTSKYDLPTVKDLMESSCSRTNIPSPPEKLSTMCLRVLCKYTNVAMCSKDVKKSNLYSDKASSYLTSKTKLIHLSLKSVCHRKIVSMLYKKEERTSIFLDTVEACDSKNTQGFEAEKILNMSCTLTPEKVDVITNLSTYHVKSLKILCTETFNAIVCSTRGQVLSIPAITDVRQINNFSGNMESDDESLGDDYEFPDNHHYDDLEEPDQSNWVANILLRDLKSCVPLVNSNQASEESQKLSLNHVSSSQDNDLNQILGGIRLKVEPIDRVEDASENPDINIAIKIEKHTLAGDGMVNLPNVNIPPKTEIDNNPDNENTCDPLMANLTEDFLENTFQEILRRNKIQLQGSGTPPTCESPNEIFSQSQHRVRREFEPDSDNDNDGMGLLIPQRFRDVNVQPVSKAKGTLLESSSSDESKKQTSVKRKRGRPKKNKNENENKKVPIISKDRPSNEIEILTRRMRERIRNQEKQKELSSDSDNDVLYKLKDTSRAENIDQIGIGAVEVSSDKQSLRRKGKEETKALKSGKILDVSIDNSNAKRDSSEFSGFTIGTTNENELATLRSCIQYMNEKGVNESNDVSAVPNVTPEGIGINQTYNDTNLHSQSDNDADDNFDDRDSADNYIQNTPDVDSRPPKAMKDSVDEMDEMGVAMLTPQVNIVIDEHNKVDLGFRKTPRGRKKKQKEVQDSNGKKEDCDETKQDNDEIKQDIKDTSAAVVSPDTNSIVDENKEASVSTCGIEVKVEETGDWTLRDGWKCHKISHDDMKLHQICYVPMDKLPESFVQTYFQFVQISRSNENERDSEIDRLTNMKSLHRTPQQREGGKGAAKVRGPGEGSSEPGPGNEQDYEELEPSDDDHAADTEMPNADKESVEVKNEDTLAKNSLLGEAGSESDGSEMENKPLADRKHNKKKPTEVAAPTNPESLVLTADKVMKKSLDLLHAPVVIDDDKHLIKPHPEKVQQKPHKAGTSSKEKHVSDGESDGSSEEEKQWITTKEKLLRRLEKKNKERLEIDDDKRARIVSDYIEKKSDEPNKYAASLISRRRRLRQPRAKTRKQKEKELRFLSMELQKELAFGATSGELSEMMNLPIHGKKVNQASYFKGRRNIRKVIDKKSLARSTVIANMEECERKRRLGNTQQQLCEHLGCMSTVKAIVINSQLCLEYDFQQNMPVVTVHRAFTAVMKAHQCEGVKFMWDASFETLERINSGHQGGGCILAHCMGLGKTLQVLALLHTVMTHRQVGVKRVLVCCPLSTVLNWVDEIHKWMGPVPNKIKVFELSKLKKTYERAYQLEDWYNGGGIFIVGYELFRSLTTLHPYLDDIRPTIINKINTALIDPGPDIVVCDEGHLLKNDCSGLAMAMSRVKTRRRIVLTGTPMQNNLREYYCMVNFVKPNLLGTYSEFSNRFENPIMNGQHRDSSEGDIRLMKARSHILHRVLEGCLQRQEASVLYPYLPKKTEYTVFISLTKCQSDLYKHYLRGIANQNKQSILKDFHILQKIWTHPQVLHNFQLKARDGIPMKDELKMEDDLGTEELTSEEMKTAGAGGEVWWTQYLDDGQMLDALESSNKFQVVFRILEQCLRVGDKLLIFSTSLLTMDSLEYFLKSINKWSLGREYYRLDGSVPPEVRQKWCREFNADNNTNTKLFLISTRAGCLGLNMTAANRVIILDTSWNPAHDIQSIFRVYRFGQRKDCFIYRLVSMGTMEQKIYERSVTKQAVACRVVDEQQIDRHYNMAELTELYRFDDCDRTSVRGEGAVRAGDPLLQEVVARLPAVRAVHEHDSLLRDSCEQQLPEHERAAAWDQFQREQEHTQKQSFAENQRGRKRGPVPAKQQVQIPIQNTFEGTLLGVQTQGGSVPSTSPPPLSALRTSPPPLSALGRPPPLGIDSPSKRPVVKPRRYRLASDSSTDSVDAPEAVGDPDWDKSLRQIKRQHLYQPIKPAPVKVVTIDGQGPSLRVYAGKAPMAGTSTSTEGTIVLSDTEQGAVAPPPTPRPRGELSVKKTASLMQQPEKAKDGEKVALHPSLLANPYFLKIVAHTYRSWNPNLEDEAATAAAEFSARQLLKKGGEIMSGTLHDIAVKTLGLQTMKVLWHNYQVEKASNSTAAAAPKIALPKLPPKSAPGARVTARASSPYGPRPPAPAVRTVPAVPTSAAHPGRGDRAMQEPMVQEPQPVSLHAGAPPAAPLPYSLIRSTVELSDCEEESILPDDDVPRIGNASPPPPRPPTPPFVPHRTARKKTTPRTTYLSKEDATLPAKNYDVVSLPPGQTPQRPGQPPATGGQAPKRYTVIHKKEAKPTHIMASDNTIVPIVDVQSTSVPPPPLQALTPPPPRPIGAAPDTTICLDSDDDDVAPAPPCSDRASAQPHKNLNYSTPASSAPTIVGGPVHTSQFHGASQIPPSSVQAQTNFQNQMQSNINTNQMQPNSMNFGQMQPNSMNVGQMQPNSMNVGQMQPNSMNFGQMQPNSMNFGQMQPNSMNFGQMQPNSINFGQMQPNSMDLGQMQPNSMDLGQMQPNSMSVGQMQPNSMNVGQTQPNLMNIGQMPQNLLKLSEMPANIQSLIAKGTRMGNIILVPASVLHGAMTAGAPTADAPTAGATLPNPTAVQTAVVSTAQEAPVPVQETPALPRKRGRPRKLHNRGRPRKDDTIKVGERLIFKGNNLLRIPAEAPSAPAAQKVPARPEKPPSTGVQEPTSTTGDEPSVDLTEEAPARRGRQRSASSSSSSSSSESSSASSRPSSPDTPLNIFKNVVRIPANLYDGSAQNSQSIHLDDEPPQARSNKAGQYRPSKPEPIRSTKPEPIRSTKPETIRSTKPEQFRSTKTGLDSVRPGPSSSKYDVYRSDKTESYRSTKPGPNSYKPGPSSAKSGAGSSKLGAISTRPDRYSDKPKVTKPTVLRKSSTADTADWQQPKMLRKTPTSGDKKSTSSKSASGQTVDLTDAPPPPKRPANERLLGMVDLTDEPAAGGARGSVSRSAGVTSTQGARNITFTNTGAITFTSSNTGGGGGGPDKPKVVKVTNIKADGKAAAPATSANKITVISEKRKAPDPPAATSKKPKRPPPMTLEDFVIDDIMEDIIELE